MRMALRVLGVPRGRVAASRAPRHAGQLELAHSQDGTKTQTSGRKPGSGFHSVSLFGLQFPQLLNDL